MSQPNNPPTNKAQPEELKDVLWRIGAFDTLNHDQHIELQRFIANQVAAARIDEVMRLAQSTNNLMQGTYGVTSVELAHRLAELNHNKATLKAGGKDSE